MNPSAIIANDIADLADRLTDDLLKRHSDIIRAGEKIQTGISRERGVSSKSGPGEQCGLTMKHGVRL